MMSYEKKITTIYLFKNKLNFLKQYAKLSDMNFTQLVNILINEAMEQRILQDRVHVELQDNEYYKHMKENL